MIFAILGIILCFLIYFEAIEMSLVSSDEYRLSNLAHKRGKGYMIANNMRKRPDVFLSTALTGINLMTVLFSMLLTREIGITRGLIVSTLMIAVVGEILVKSLTIINPEMVSMIIAPTIFFFYWLLSPLIFFVKGIGDVVLRLFGIKEGSKEKITKEELNIAVKEVRAAGGLEPEQYTAMRSISELSKTDVRDIMIPRIEIEAISSEENIEDLEQILENLEVAKVPVYKDSIDNITGILFKEDIIGGLEKWSVKDKLRPIKFIHGDRSLEETLPELLSDKNGCAIVIDEYGGTEGFVSTDDILFYIFSTPLEIEGRDGGTFIVDADIRPDSLGIITDEDTLAGYIVKKLQKIPPEGQKLVVGGMQMTVLDATERKIRKVLIKKE